MAEKLMDVIERDVLQEIIERTGGNKQQAAKIMGMYRHRLYDRLKKHGLFVPYGRKAKAAASTVFSIEPMVHISPQCKMCKK